jgi:hypothetical protein
MPWRLFSDAHRVFYKNKFCEAKSVLCRFVMAARHDKATYTQTNFYRKTLMPFAAKTVSGKSS